MIRRLLPVVFVLGLLFVPSAQAASEPPLGYYSCYQTTLNTSPVNGSTSYATYFTDSFTLLKKHRYKLNLITSNPIPKWTYAHKTIRFRGGPFDDNTFFWHILADYHHKGVTMPNSQLPDPAQKFTLVLRDRFTNDSDVAPPANESGTASFFYCRRR